MRKPDGQAKKDNEEKEKQEQTVENSDAEDPGLVSMMATDLMFFGAEQKIYNADNIFKKSGTTTNEVPSDDDGAQARKTLPMSAILPTETNRYAILRRLGGGAFGDVYSAKRMDGTVVAIKTEMVSKLAQLQRLKREVLMYEAVNDARRRPATEFRSRHILHMLDRGQNPYFKYVVIPLLGVSLDVIRNKIMNRDFAEITVMQIAWQTFLAIKNMHNLGYIHRDVKPDNFVVGKDYHRQTIFIMDFGMATCYDVEVENKNSDYEFIGTARYAGRNVHHGLIAQRRDDLESWLFMIIELFGEDFLPWFEISNKTHQLYLKEAFFNKKYDEPLMMVLPLKLLKIRDVIGLTEGADEPKYELIEEALNEMIQEAHGDPYASWEWAQTLAPVIENRDIQDDKLSMKSSLVIKDKDKEQRRKKRRKKKDNAADMPTAKERREKDKETLREEKPDEKQERKERDPTEKRDERKEREEKEKAAEKMPRNSDIICSEPTSKQSVHKKLTRKRFSNIQKKS